MSSILTSGRRELGVSVRLFSTSSSSVPPPPPVGHGLSHVDPDGSRPTMVDVSGKSITKRTAVAQSIVLLPENVAKLFIQDGVKDFHTPKGQHAHAHTHARARNSASVHTATIISCIGHLTEPCTWHSLFVVCVCYVCVG